MKNLLNKYTAPNYTINFGLRTAMRLSLICTNEIDKREPRGDFLVLNCPFFDYFLLTYRMLQ